MKVSSLIKAAPALISVMQQPLPVKFAVRLMALMDELDPVLTDYNDGACSDDDHFDISTPVPVILPALDSISMTAYDVKTLSGLIEFKEGII